MCFSSRPPCLQSSRIAGWIPLVLFCVRDFRRRNASNFHDRMCCDADELYVAGLYGVHQALVAIDAKGGMESASGYVAHCVLTAMSRWLRDCGTRSSDRGYVARRVKERAAWIALRDEYSAVVMGRRAADACFLPVEARDFCDQLERVLPVRVRKIVQMVRRAGVTIEEACRATGWSRPGLARDRLRAVAPSLLERSAVSFRGL